MIKIELPLDEAVKIYRNLQNHFIAPDDQRAVYDFVHELERLIDLEIKSEQHVDNRPGK